MKAQILLTDTDNLIHKTEVENVYEDFCKVKELLDFGNYWRDSSYLISYLVIGKKSMRCAYKRLCVIKI